MMLLPFEQATQNTVGNPDANNSILDDFFDKYTEIARKEISFVPLEEADFALLPVSLEKYDSTTPEPIKRFINLVQEKQKKLVVFAGHDTNPTYSIPNAIIFSGAIYRSTMQPGYRVYPHFFEDFIKKFKQGNLSVREKGEKPIVGFCGYAPPLNLKWGKEKMIGMAKLIANYMGLFDKFPQRSSHSYRARTLITLLRSNKVVCNFLIKNKFGFGALGLNSGNTGESNEEFRLKYINNILGSDYTVCARGYGNNSIRLYETMCCGRIPVFLNTDCVLPFENEIDWKNLCVWVERKDMNKIAEKISKYHANINSEQFKERQLLMRSLWEKYFSPQAFFSQVPEIVNTIK